MKVLLAHIMISLKAVSSEVQIPISRITDSLQTKIALDVLKVSPVNTVVSAFLLRFPLCKLAAVAEGRAKIELMIALGFPSGDNLIDCYTQFRRDLHYITQTDLLIANKMYINESLDVDMNFIENSTSSYGLRVEKVGFRYPQAAAKFINNWIERDMLKRVGNIIDPGDININTSIVILNAAHFKGTWENPFYYQLTTEKKFRNLNGTLFKVPMMVTMDEVLFIDDPNLDVKVFSKNFQETTITFAIPLSVDGMPKFINKIYDDCNLMKKLKGSMKRKVLTLSIPKFKIKTYVDWSGFLRIIGVSKIFDPKNSGLNGILKHSTDSKAYLSKVKQKISMELDEIGSVRKAPDAASRDLLMIQANMDKTDELTLDRPFYFTVSFKNSKSEYELMSGVYYGPREV